MLATHTLSIAPEKDALFDAFVRLFERMREQDPHILDRFRAIAEQHKDDQRGIVAKHIVAILETAEA